MGDIITLDEQLIKMAKKTTPDRLYMEAECVEEYGEWMSMSHIGLEPDTLRAMAQYLEENED